MVSTSISSSCGRLVRHGRKRSGELCQRELAVGLGSHGDRRIRGTASIQSNAANAHPFMIVLYVLWLFTYISVWSMCAYQLYYFHTMFSFSSLQSYRMFFASNDGPSKLCFQKWCLMCLVECMLPRKHQNSPISSYILLFWPFGLDLFASPWTLPWHTLSWKITCSLTSEKCSCLVYIYHRKGGM